MNTPLPDPPSNLDTVLAALGRASTPAVKDSPFGITRGALMGLSDAHGNARAVVVGSPHLVRRVQEATPAVAGVPGLLVEQVELPLVETLVIDWDAFQRGPWLAANTHAAVSLKEEIFEAGRRMRARGRLVLGLPLRPLSATGDARLLSTCTVDMTAVPEADLEEGAPQSPVWITLAGVVQDRARMQTAPSAGGM